MKARFTDEQVISMIKQQEVGEKTADVCRRHVRATVVAVSALMDMAEGVFQQPGTLVSVLASQPVFVLAMARAPRTRAFPY